VYANDGHALATVPFAGGWLGVHALRPGPLVGVPEPTPDVLLVGDEWLMRAACAENRRDVYALGLPAGVDEEGVACFRGLVRDATPGERRAACVATLLGRLVRFRPLVS